MHLVDRRLQHRPGLVDVLVAGPLLDLAEQHGAAAGADRRAHALQAVRLELDAPRVPGLERVSKPLEPTGDVAEERVEARRAGCRQAQAGRRELLEYDRSPVWTRANCGRRAFSPRLARQPERLP